MAIAIRSNGQISYPFLSAGAFTAALAVRETGPAGAPKPRLLDRVREAIAARHYSHSTEKAYINWIKRYIFFHRKTTPTFSTEGRPGSAAPPTGCSCHDLSGQETDRAVRGSALDI